MPTKTPLWPFYWFIPGSITLASWVFALRNGASQVLDPTPRLWTLGGISLLVTAIEIAIVVSLHRRSYSRAANRETPANQKLAFALAVVVGAVGLGIQILVASLNPIPIV